jgi:hypothetical protein
MKSIIHTYAWPPQCQVHIKLLKNANLSGYIEVIVIITVNPGSSSDHSPKFEHLSHH